MALQMTGWRPHDAVDGVCKQGWMLGVRSTCCEIIGRGRQEYKLAVGVLTRVCDFQLAVGVLTRVRDFKVPRYMLFGMYYRFFDLSTSTCVWQIWSWPCELA